MAFPSCCALLHPHPGPPLTKADPDHGPIRLVCLHTPAKRWVFHVKEVQINQ